MYPDCVTSQHQTFRRGDDDGECRLRLEFSGGVDWRPILRTALEIWVPDALRSRVGDITGTLAVLAGASTHVVFELRHEDGGLVARVGDPDPASETGAEAGVVRRWKPPSSR